MRARELKEAVASRGLTWLDVAAPSGEDLAAVSEALDIDLHAIAAVAHPMQRPRHLIGPSWEGMILAATAKGHDLQQVAVLFGDRWVLSIREHTPDLFEPVRSWLAHVAASRSVDRTLVVVALVEQCLTLLYDRLEAFRNDLDDLEGALLEESQKSVRSPFGRLHRIRQRLLQLERVVEPMREALIHATHWRTAHWDPEAVRHAREAANDARHLLDLVEDAQRTSISLGQMYVSVLGSRTNAVVTLLSVISTLFLPMTFLASVWAMRFEYMPEVKWRWGYAFALAMMALSALVLLVILYRLRSFRALRRAWAAQREDDQFS